jgi:hypothetical protein
VTPETLKKHVRVSNTLVHVFINILSILGDISAPFSTPETIRKSIEKTGKNGTADHSRNKPGLA